jgi:hypothetical protein
MTINWDGFQTEIPKNQSKKPSCITCPSEHHWCTSSHFSENVYEVAILGKKQADGEHNHQRHKKIIVVIHETQNERFFVSFTPNRQFVQSVQYKHFPYHRCQRVLLGKSGSDLLLTYTPNIKQTHLLGPFWTRALIHVLEKHKCKWLYISNNFSLNM